MTPADLDLTGLPWWQAILQTAAVFAAPFAGLFLIGIILALVDRGKRGG